MKSEDVPTDLSTVILYYPSQHLYLTKSRAILHVTSMLRMPWSLLYYPMKIVPESVRDRMYMWVGRNRYRIFGKKESEKECCKFE